MKSFISPLLTLRIGYFREVSFVRFTLVSESPNSQMSSTSVTNSVSKFWTSTFKSSLPNKNRYKNY